MRDSKGNDTLVVALDGDKLGQIGGTAMALAVLALCFFWSGTDTTTALVRAGWAFIFGYGATFLMTRVILRTSLQEMLEAEEASSKKPRIGAQEAEPDPMANVTLDDLGLESLTPRADS